MVNFNRILAVSAVILIALAGCNKSEPTATTTTTPAATPSAPAASPVSAPAATTSGTYSGVLGVVTKTKTAINAGDFAKANTEFSQFEDNWEKVEDGIKAKSDKSYKAIEDSADNVEKALKQSKPDKQKVLTELNSIETSLNSVAK